MAETLHPHEELQLMAGGVKQLKSVSQCRLIFVKDSEYSKEEAKLKRSTATVFALSLAWVGLVLQANLTPPKLLVLKSGTFLLAPPWSQWFVTYSHPL